MNERYSINVVRSLFRELWGATHRWEFETIKSIKDGRHARKLLEQMGIYTRKPESAKSITLPSTPAKQEVIKEVAKPTAVSVPSDRDFSWDYEIGFGVNAPRDNHQTLADRIKKHYAVGSTDWKLGEDEFSVVTTYVTRAEKILGLDHDKSPYLKLDFHGANQTVASVYIYYHAFNRSFQVGIKFFNTSDENLRERFAAAIIHDLNSIDGLILFDQIHSHYGYVEVDQYLDDPHTFTKTTVPEPLSHTAPAKVPFDFYNITLPTLIFAAFEYPFLWAAVIGLSASSVIVWATYFIQNKFFTDNSQLTTEGKSVGDKLQKIDLGGPARRAVAQVVKDFMPTRRTYENITRDFSNQLEIGWERGAGKNVEGHSSLLALRTFVNQPTGNEKGPRIVVEWGGSNRHTTLWDLLGQGKHIKHPSIDWRFTKEQKADPMSTVDDIVDTVKQLVKRYSLKGPIELGFTFAFPAEIRKINQAFVVRMNKGWSDPKGEFIGEDVVKILQDKLNAADLSNVTVTATSNDTLNPMVEKNYQEQGLWWLWRWILSGFRAWVRYTISMVLGTGFNIALDYKDDIRNLETGNFDGVEIAMNELDKFIDNNAPEVAPGAQLMEKNGHR
jgi:hypothetical protein